MKQFLEKSARIISWIVGYGLMITLFLGGLSFFGYFIAIIIGGEKATAICQFIYKDCYPWLIKSTSILVILGLIKMYLKGETSLSAKKRQTQIKDDKKVE